MEVLALCHHAIAEACADRAGPRPHLKTGGRARGDVQGIVAVILGYEDMVIVSPHRSGEV